MEKKVMSGITLALLLISMFAVILDIQQVKSEPRTWTVDDGEPADFHTIQEAINAAFPGDTIYVRAGIYRENLVVNKTISLVGEEREKTIIEGSGTGNVVLVTAGNVNIGGFIVQNGIYPWNGILLSYSSSSNLIGNNVVNNYIGIELEYCSNNTIINNTASYNVLGIRLLYSSNNMLVDNTVSENRHGINLDASSGNTLSHNTMIGNSYNFGVWGRSSSDFDNNVYLNNTADGKPIYYVKGVSNVVYDQSTNAATIYIINSVNVTVKDLKISNNLVGIHFWNTRNSQIVNVITSNNEFGIVLKRSNFNVLFDNFASNNAIGIHFEQSRINRLASNNIAYNLGWGIHFYKSNSNMLVNNKVSNSKNGIELDYSSDNVIYHNNFFNNLKQVSTVDSKNIWDDGYPSGGNYWSDYTVRYPGAQELDDSDIWDTPYVIDANNRDRYPLINPWTTVVTATVDIAPDTLNLRSKGWWTTAYIELPKDYDVNDINASTILLNDTISAELIPTAIGDYDNDAVSDLMVKFDRAEVTEYILTLVDIEQRFTTVALTITGKLNDGTPLQGSDTIKIIYMMPRYERLIYIMLRCERFLQWF